MQINWSGRSHKYSNNDINYLVKIIKTADPLTQGKYLKKFEYVFSKYIKKENVFAVSSAAAALEIISLLLNIKKGMKLLFRHILIVHLQYLLHDKGQKSFGQI